MSKSERKRAAREEFALDVLLASALRMPEIDPADPANLPELTAEERQAMDDLGSDFITNLLARHREE